MPSSKRRTLKHRLFGAVFSCTDKLFGLIAEGLALINDRREWRRLHG
jgi:hypothetical protein